MTSTVTFPSCFFRYSLIIETSFFVCSKNSFSVVVCAPKTDSLNVPTFSNLGINLPKSSSFEIGMINLPSIHLSLSLM